MCKELVGRMGSPFVVLLGEHKYIGIPTEALGNPIRSWVCLRICQQLDDLKNLFTIPTERQK